MDICISKQQAQTFASTVVADIKPYVEAHKEEYEAFLKREYANQEER